MELSGSQVLLILLSKTEKRRDSSLNYTLMSSVRSILVSMKLPKSLWEEILKTVAYLKNRSPSQKELTPYERADGETPNLGHLRVIGSRAWVHVPEKLRKKLNDTAWQGIFVGYEGRNLYRIYHPLTGKIHKTRDVEIDEGLLYDKSEVNTLELQVRNGRI